MPRERFRNWETGIELYQKQRATSMRFGNLINLAQLKSTEEMWSNDVDKDFWLNVLSINYYSEGHHATDFRNDVPAIDCRTKPGWWIANIDQTLLPYLVGKPCVAKARKERSYHYDSYTVDTYIKVDPETKQILMKKGVSDYLFENDYLVFSDSPYAKYPKKTEELSNFVSYESMISEIISKKLVNPLTQEEIRTSRNLKHLNPEEFEPTEPSETSNPSERAEMLGITPEEYWRQIMKDYTDNQRLPSSGRQTWDGD